MDNTENDNTPTIEPVTTSGWYELVDGRVAECVWRNGILRTRRVVASWAEVVKVEEEDRKAEADYEQWRDRELKRSRA